MTATLAITGAMASCASRERTMIMAEKHGMSRFVNHAGVRCILDPLLVLRRYLALSLWYRPRLSSFWFFFFCWTNFETDE